MPQQFNVKRAACYRLLCVGFVALLLPSRMYRTYDVSRNESASPERGIYLAAPGLTPGFTPGAGTPTPSPTATLTATLTPTTVPIDVSTATPSPTPIIALDSCPDDPNKTSPGVCGCGVPDTDANADSVIDCVYSEPALPCGQDASVALEQRIVADTSGLVAIATAQANGLAKLVKAFKKRYGKTVSDTLDRFVKAATKSLQKAQAATDTLVETLPSTLVLCAGDPARSPIDNTQEKAQMTRNVSSLVKTGKRIAARAAFFKIIKNPNDTPNAAQNKKIKAAQKATNQQIDALAAKLNALIAKVPDNG